MSIQRASVLLCASLGAWSMPLPGHAGTIQYRVTVQTADVYLAGTDNWVKFQLCDASGKCTAAKDLPGHHERNDVEEGTLALEDIGVPSTLKLDVSGDLADKWHVYSVSVDRLVAAGTKDGSSFFLIDKELGYDEESFSATYSEAAKISAQVSAPVASKRVLDHVSFCNNQTGDEQAVCSSYKEAWARAEEIGVSSTSSVSTTSGVKGTYTYGNDAAMHHISVEAWLEIQAAVEDTKSVSTATSRGGETDYQFYAPSGQACLRKMRITVPTLEQELTLSTGETYKVQVPVGDPSGITWNDSYCMPPLGDRTLSKSQIDSTFARHMSEEDRASFDEWYTQAEAAGWLKSAATTTPETTPGPPGTAGPQGPQGSDTTRDRTHKPIGPRGGR